MKNTFNTIMSILILIVLAAGVYFIVQTVRESTKAAAEAATAPFEQVNQANQALQTQVAQMMNPTPTIIPDPITYINNIRSLARLETIQYSAEQVVTCQLNQEGILGYAIGDKLLFVGHGEVIAGIDMEKFQPGDMSLVGDTLLVKLPPAELFVVTLNNEKSYVYDRVTGPLAPTNIDLETTCRQAAEEKIRSAVLEDGILMQAQANAENYFYRFFTEQLGYDSVQFVR
ncbi:MAG: DUF4230 domain-containing protein [Anaerolineales bacterium]|nr:DUF4230 domain-containing protein [Anaerolineales bacterium]MBP6208866.1 DUF4230 domain-containing protein [Anaerolineales bacterium]MBP8165378.1 DUF4230 domain-containing protein [Anaerolineales bacterium]